MKIRAATAEDLEAVLALRSEKMPPPRPIRRATSESRMAALLDSYHRYWRWVGKDPDFVVWLVEDENGVQGVLPVVNGSTDSITDETQAIALDLCVRADQPAVMQTLLENAEDFARKGNMEYLIGDVPVEDTALEAVLEERGYIPDLNRIIMPTDPSPRVRDRYPIRPARSTDYFFILSLNSLVNQNTIPPGRKADPNKVSRGYMFAYSTLKHGSDPQMPTWISDDPDKECSAGYLMIKTGKPDPVTGETYGYIYEVAVHPDYWGRRIVDDLLGTAARQLAPQGIPYFTGDVSQANLRALKTAQRNLGFVIEQRRWSKSLIS